MYFKIKEKDGNESKIKSCVFYNWKWVDDVWSVEREIICICFLLEL